MAVHATSTTAPAAHPRLRGGDAPARLLLEREVLALVGGDPEDQPLLPLSEPLAYANAAHERHMRRALEGAVEHGAALLAALGLPRLAGRDFVMVDPIVAGNALEAAIATLDELDATIEDLEDGHDAEHDTADLEDDGSDEPALGSPEQHSSAYCLWSPTRDRSGSQTHWWAGRNDAQNDGEAEPGYDLPEGDDERCGSDDVEGEHSLGSAIGNGDQEYWSQGQAGEGEADPLDAIRCHIRYELAVASNQAARVLVSEAVAIRRRKDGGTAPHQRDVLTQIAPGIMSWAGPSL